MGKAKRGGTYDHRLAGGREGFQPDMERSEGEIKAMGVDFPMLRQKEGGAQGNASRTQPVTAKGRGGPRGRPTTRYFA